MKKYQKIFAVITLSLFVFGFAGVKTVKAITIEEIKAQIVLILAKITEIQNEINKLAQSEADTTPKSIAIVSPNGGEKWEAGNTYSIRWNSSGFSSDSKVQINLLNDKYSQNLPGYESNITDTQNNGLYSWQIPVSLNSFGLFGSLYKIAVYAGEESNKLSDVSSAYFTINQAVPSYIDIVYPNGGEILETGKTYNIKWDSLGMENYKTTLILKKSEATYLIIAENISNNSFYSWKVPQDLYGSSYKTLINIYDNNGNLVSSDVSNNNFTIIQAVSSEKIEQQLASIAKSIVVLLEKAKEFIAR